MYKSINDNRLLIFTPDVWFLNTWLVSRSKRFQGQTIKHWKCSFNQKIPKCMSNLTRLYMPGDKQTWDLQENYVMSDWNIIDAGLCRLEIVLTWFVLMWDIAGVIFSVNRTRKWHISDGSRDPLVFKGI